PIQSLALQRVRGALEAPSERRRAAGQGGARRPCAQGRRAGGGPVRDGPREPHHGPRRNPGDGGPAPARRSAPSPASASTSRGAGGSLPPEAGWLSLISNRLKQDERSAVLRSVEDGSPVVKACKEAGVAGSCVSAYDACMQDAACAPKLAQATGYSRDAVFAIRTNPQP